MLIFMDKLYSHMGNDTLQFVRLVLTDFVCQTCKDVELVNLDSSFQRHIVRYLVTLITYLMY